MKNIVLVTILLILLSSNIYANEILTPKLLHGIKLNSIDEAKEFIIKSTDPLFPKDINIKTIYFDINNKKFVLISLDYSEYNGQTRTNSSYFFSIWDINNNKYNLIASNYIDVYDTKLAIHNNILTIIAKKDGYDPATYIYSFVYKNNEFYFYQILKSFSLKDDYNPKQLNEEYLFFDKNSHIKVSNIFIDELISKNGTTNKNN